MAVFLGVILVIIGLDFVVRVLYYTPAQPVLPKGLRRRQTRICLKYFNITFYRSKTETSL